MASYNKVSKGTILVAILLIAAIIGTFTYIWTSNDVITKIGLWITNATRTVSPGSYLSNVTFRLEVIVNSSDIFFPINMTAPFFVLTVDPPFYFFGNAEPQFLPHSPRSEIICDLAFVGQWEPTATNVMMSERSTQFELELYGLASAGFSQHHIYRMISQSWTWH